MKENTTELKRIQLIVDPEELDVLKKLIWLNIILTWMAVTFTMQVALFVILDNFIWQSLSFLLVSLFSLVYWNRKTKKLQELLK